MTTVLRKIAEETGIKLYFTKNYSEEERDGIRWFRDGGDRKYGESIYENILQLHASQVDIKLFFI